MRVFFSIILGLIALVLIISGLSFLSDGSFSSGGGHGDINISGIFAMLGVINIVFGIVMGFVAKLIYPRSGKKPDETIHIRQK
ncbi:hypothetical protein [Zophobihabitans entericus]|uniref:Uncharacterized protein n=1 Tax=Zophobihabitans entericus TaxID=1635327 RepID=A0A6G9I9D0_9GAMM|nr:hypothetical protein [Zophobihabitans entericus]QIQ20439.1 hypothetical protein IPMB12_01335 [Zophobihabitans entericus]